MIKNLSKPFKWFFQLEAASGLILLIAAIIALIISNSNFSDLYFSTLNQYLFIGINEFGLTGPCNDKLINTLKRANLEAGLTDKAMIKSWAAQLINYVYWAKQLGVGDYLASYKQAFIEVYPNDKDNKLTKKQFRNRQSATYIYKMS